MNDQPSRPPINPITIWIPIVMIALGLVVFWNYLFKLKRDQMSDRLPIEKRLEKNLVLTERSGRTVELKQLKGKVFVASWVFTRCPRGCPGVVGEMIRLYKDFSADPNMQFVSFSVDPDDTPELLNKFTEKFGIKGDNWWFLNGKKDDLRVYMTRYFGFNEVRDVPENERFSPDDKFVHDMRVALVDHLGQVRGFYDIGSPDKETREFYQEKIRKDMRTLLGQVNAPGRSPYGFYAFIGLIGGSIIFLIGMRIREGRARANS
ncbi:MAG: SCO family protein [Verrucomicrobia bacterium]|nr:SCO family protein [Verrucomicrobiota bacterium]